MPIKLLDMKNQEPILRINPVPGGGGQGESIKTKYNLLINSLNCYFSLSKLRMW